MPYTPPPSEPPHDALGPIDGPDDETVLCITLPDLYAALAYGAAIGCIVGAVTFFLAAVSTST